MKKLVLLIVLLISHGVVFKLGSFYGFHSTISARESHGRFLSAPKAEWLEGRDMRLLEDFVYIDPDEEAWLAPRGSVVNGASIPQALWSWIGGPFEGKYRNASIVHDVACEAMQRSHEEVHRMFFDACMAGGVPEAEAKQLYWAVANFGPRWQTEQRTAMRYSAKSVQGAKKTAGKAASESYTITVPLIVPEPSEEELAWAEEFFSKNNPSLAEIEALDPPGEQAGP